jgi:Tfp pilus assembly protein PilF
MSKKYSIFLLVPVLIYVLYWGNIKPLLASQAAVRGKAQKALSYHTFVNHEIRKTLAQQALKSDNGKFVLFAVKEMEQNVKERPLDVKSYILLSHLYYRLRQNEKARWAAERALELAPKREDVKSLYNLINDHID